MPVKSIPPICPTGKSANCPSSPLCKNILLRHLVETDLLIPPSRPTRGALAIVTNVGMGCGGRGSVLRVKRLQGGFFESVSDTERADERRCCGRRSRVVLTPRRWRQVCGRQLSQATVANKPGHRGEHEVVVKPLR